MLSDNTLIEMNAYEENKLNNEYDFERRTAAFNRINKGEFKTLLTENPDVLEAVLRHYMWSLRDPETLMRRFAATGVSRILRHISDLASRENNDSTQNMIRVFVRNIVFPGLRVWLQDYKTSEVIRRELLVLLTEAISLFEKLSDHASLHGDLACLCRPNDIEADFWRNLLHTQLHRRIRALRRMAESIRTFTTTLSFLSLSFSSVLQCIVAFSSVAIFVYDGRDIECKLLLLPSILVFSPLYVRNKEVTHLFLFLLPNSFLLF
jgi:hypothetical protein